MLVIPHNKHNFSACVPVCHRCKPHHVEGFCTVDFTTIISHADSGYCPKGKFTVNNPKPDSWETLAGNEGDFPLVIPDTPVSLIREMIDKPVKRLPLGWQTWPNVQQAYREAMAELVIPPCSSGVGKGIVICGGGPYFASAYITATIVKHLGCRLPIEVWALPGEIESWQRALFAEMGVTVHEPDNTFRKASNPGWQLKSWAILHSSFRQVLLLDADCYPIREPSFLFDLPQFKDHGAVFWPDQPRFDLQSDTWALLGLPARDEPDVESGQILVDKERFWEPLWLACWINQRSDYYYTVRPGPSGIHGDKTTFHLAARYLNRDYAMPADRWELQSPAMLQKDFAGNTLFIHRCNGKLSLLEDASGTKAFSTTGQVDNPFNPELPLEDFSWETLTNLREIAKKHVAPVPKIAAPANVDSLLKTYHDLWDELHNNTVLTQEWLDGWIKKIPGNCSCQNGWAEVVRKRPPDFSSRWKFFLWSVCAHNDVNEKLGKPEFPFTSACFLYKVFS